MIEENEILQLRQRRDDVVKQVRELSQQSQATPLLSRRGIADHFGELLHTVSGGKLGQPSVYIRVIELCEEGFQLNFCLFRLEIEKMEQGLER